MTSIRMHPSELGYAFSYAETVDIIGWGRDPFLPTRPEDGDPKRWYVDGAARLTDAGRLYEAPEKGLMFTDDITAFVLALVDPTIVFLAERKAGDGLRRLTVHVGRDAIVGMTRDPDGTLELTKYADLTAAGVACSGFLGVALSPVEAGTRVDKTQEALTIVHQLAKAGQTDQVASALGVSETDATSIVAAMADPAAAGVLSVLYCSDNVARNAEPFSVMTNADDETWIIFPPASLEGPMVLERSSVSALTGRILIGVAAKLPSAA